jgi:hypothetical protein
MLYRVHLAWAGIKKTYFGKLINVLTNYLFDTINYCYYLKRQTFENSIGTAILTYKNLDTAWYACRCPVVKVLFDFHANFQ